jgi:choline dehydrogenase-like flavoprotein
MGGSSGIHAGEELAPDLCIVGAGPAGIALATELDRLGMSVCLLEAGGLEVESAVQAQSRGESDGYPLVPLDHSRVRAFGGTLRHRRLWDRGWAARPLDAVDFESRGGSDDLAWPFGLSEITDLYARAEKLCGILPFADATAALYRDAPSAAQALVSDELEGTVFQFPIAAFHDSWAELSVSSDVHVHLHTRVVSIDLDSSGRRVGRILAVRSDGAEVVVRARVVVLATGGIENARLLLTAREGRGLGNEHGLVGRFFAERLSFHAGHLELAHADVADELAIFHQRDSDAVGGAIRLSDAAQRERGILNCVFFLVPRPRAVTASSVRSVVNLRRGVQRRPHGRAWGKHLHNVVTGLPDLADLAVGRVLPRPQALALRVQAEQSPNPNSRVTLGRRRDDLGIPVARVTWAMNDLDRQSIRASVDVLDVALGAAGLGSVTYTAELGSTTLVEGNNHHLGTTRMHADPRRGVVDPDGRVHSVDNLYVTGSSVFPSHGASNPTLTIVALALRLADHLRAELEH